MPYIGDHDIVLNKREKEVSLSNFGSNLRDTKLHHVDHIIVNYLPECQKVLRYSFSGQLQ